MRWGNSRTGVGGKAGVNLTAVHPHEYGKKDTYDRTKGKSHYTVFSLKKLGFMSIALFYVKLQRMQQEG